MGQSADVFNEVPPGLIDCLGAHLPQSIPLLRRLQFTAFPSGKSESTRIIVASDLPFSTSNGASNMLPKHCAVAYMDLSKGRETNSWMYSTLEDANSDPYLVLSPEDTAICENQILAVADAMKRQGREFDGELGHPDSIIIGTLNTEVRDVMIRHGLDVYIRTEYDKFIWHMDEMPPDAQLPEGMRWETGSSEDCALAVARTDVPRSVATLSTFPNLFIKLDDGAPIAWAFLGADGSLSSLHCEEPYRGRGLAKALGAKLVREKTALYGDDGYSSADVAPDNISSGAVCKSLGGKSVWMVSWIQLGIRE